MNNISIKIYTDGSSLSNPGSAGWAFRAEYQNRVLEDCGYFKVATNNQMEIYAILMAFKFLIAKKISNYKIEIYSDSSYCVNALNDWLSRWALNNWKKANKKPVLNQDYWQEILKLKKEISLKNQLLFIHIKAHIGIEGNERVDFLARTMAENRGERKSEILN